MMLSLCVAVVFTIGTTLIPETLISIYSRDPLVIEMGAVYLRNLSPGFIPFALSTVLILTLRSVEKIRLAVTASAIALSINTVLNFVLILGAGPIPGLGIRGAAIGASTARYVEVLILLIGTYLFRYPPAGKPRELMGFNSVYVARYLRIAIPVMINETIWSLGVTIQNLIFARSSTEAIAAFNITGSISGLTWVIFIGLGNGIAILIGKKIGEGNEKEAREYSSRIIRFAPLLAVAVACILIPISHLMLRILNVEPEVMQSVRIMIIILSIFYPCKAFHSAMLIGTCRAGGDTVFCIIYDILPMWLVQLPLIALAGFVFQAPPYIIYLCLMAEDPIKVSLGLWRFKTGKWLRNVVS
jgi:putative MATE family efflux protein